MSLIKKVISKINSSSKIKMWNVSEKEINRIDKLPSCEQQIDEINKLLEKTYDKHSHLSEATYIKTQHPEPDKLPIIKYKNDTVFIQFFNIQGSYVDLVNFKKEGKKYTTYDTGTKYGNRLVKIVNMTKKALSNDNIVIDFSDCGGGDINVFFDAFSPIIGTGLLCYYEYFDSAAYCYYDGKRFVWSNKKKNIETKLPQQKHITILTNKWTGSSAEYLPMIIKSFQKDCKIKGTHTAGYLNVTSTVSFHHNNKQYMLGKTISPFVYDRNGKKYNGSLIK